MTVLWHFLDVVVHQHILLSEAIVTDFLDSDHLPIMFRILEFVRTREAFDLVEKLTDWDLFLVSIAHLFWWRWESSTWHCVSIVSENYNCRPEIPSSDLLLKYKRKPRKLWQETTVPACKPAVNWVVPDTRIMIQERAFERWKTKMANCEVTPQAIWPIERSLIKRGGSKVPSNIYGPLCPIYYP